MKKIANILFLVFLAGTSLTLAQKDYFTVLARQGEISLIKPGENKHVMVQTGGKILPGERLKISNKSYVALTYSLGSSIEINKAGIYDFNGIKNSIKKNYKSANVKFLNYVIDQVKKNEEETEEMKSFGAVVRERKNYIAPGIPFTTMVIDSIIEFKWYPNPNSKNYIFKLLNDNNVTLFMKELNDTAVTCSLNTFYLKKNKVYKWMVFDYNNSSVYSDTNYIIIPPPSRYNAIIDSIKELKSLLGEGNTAIRNIIFACFYQNNGLNIKALEAYKKALQLAPRVNSYVKMYACFLLKTKLNRMIDYRDLGG